MARRRAGEGIHINFPRDGHRTLRRSPVFAGRAPVRRVALRDDDAADVVRIKEDFDVVELYQIRVLWRCLIIAIMALGYVGAMPAEGIYLLIARVGTAYYFLHFLVILPFLSKIEKTEPLPMSISEPVLKE